MTNNKEIIKNREELTSHENKKNRKKFLDILEYALKKIDPKNLSLTKYL